MAKEIYCTCYLFLSIRAALFYLESATLLYYIQPYGPEHTTIGRIEDSKAQEGIAVDQHTRSDHQRAVNPNHCDLPLRDGLSKKGQHLMKGADTIQCVQRPMATFSLRGSFVQFMVSVRVCTGAGSTGTASITELSSPICHILKQKSDSTIQRVQSHCFLNPNFAQIHIPSKDTQQPIPPSTGEYLNQDPMTIFVILGSSTLLMVLPTARLGSI